ncbi:MAG: hypothetical protein C4617_04680 [Candidatus Liberibacter europaeus]|uniref:Uncharacterized protein n=1 Tax=Candidatus Liberibacter europaeus TaxID=744859 RepID=A0A2T4VWZ6_9HYPH|nr:hypothetical protein [Candidatus Liberibacter europaeus]PTL86297.1 MAG: hypothetical protein C4617_04680 [Candidatus Liberibacter europaeus]
MEKAIKRTRNTKRNRGRIVVEKVRDGVREYAGKYGLSDSVFGAVKYLFLSRYSILHVEKS